jgi:hypothetical protein
MAKVEINKKSKAVKLIIEQAEGSIDFVEFIDEVLGYPLVKAGTFAGSVVLEASKSKQSDSKESKQGGSDKQG